MVDWLGWASSATGQIGIESDGEARRPDPNVIPFRLPTRTRRRPGPSVGLLHGPRARSIYKRMSGVPLTPCPCAGKHSLTEKTQEADAAAATAVSFLSTDSEGGKAAAAPAEADASATAGDASGLETK